MCATTGLSCHYTTYPLNGMYYRQLSPSQVTLEQPLYTIIGCQGVEFNRPLLSTLDIKQQKHKITTILAFSFVSFLQTKPIYLTLQTIFSPLTNKTFTFDNKRIFWYQVESFECLRQLLKGLPLC